LNSQLWKAKELELLGKNLENTKSSQKILEDKIQELEDRIRVYEEEEQDIERRIVHAKAEIDDRDILRKDKIYSGFFDLNKNYERLAEEMDIAARSVKTKMGGKLREVDALINDNKLMAKKGEELDHMLQQQLAVIQQLVSEQEKKQTEKTKEKLEHIAKVESMKLEWMTKLANCRDNRGRDSQSTGKQSKKTKERSPNELDAKNGRGGFHDASQGVDLLDEEEGQEAEGSYEVSEERVATREEKWSQREGRESAKLVCLS
jgi:cob(I)alamin adenosyltransferase